MGKLRSLLLLLLLLGRNYTGCVVWGRCVRVENAWRWRELRLVCVWGFGLGLGLGLGLGSKLGWVGFGCVGGGKGISVMQLRFFD